MDPFRFLLNCVDYYQTTPTEFDPQLYHGLARPSRPQDAYQVPVIRAYGATETGQKVCAHIHGALPYLYLEYNENPEQEAVDKYVQSLRISIDRALAGSYRHDASGGRWKSVAHISLVKGVPFFGYHVGYRLFLKVYLLNPMHMTRLADLLEQGAILKTVMQPYESHLQYLAQWMCDYNLYGCAYVNCASVKFRGPVPHGPALRNPLHRWHDQSRPPERISDAGDLPRQSNCAIEVDVCVQDILNRNDIRARPIHHDFKERFSHLAPDEKYVHSVAGLWRDETIRRKRRLGLTDPGSSPFPADVLAPLSADPRDTRDGGWIHEQEFLDVMAKLVEDEKKITGDQGLEFDCFVKPHPRQTEIQTVLESVEDLYPARLEVFHATQKCAFTLGDEQDECNSAAEDGDGVSSGENSAKEQLQALDDSVPPPLSTEEDEDCFDSIDEHGSLPRQLSLDSPDQLGQKHSAMPLAANAAKRRRLSSEDGSTHHGNNRANHGGASSLKQPLGKQNPSSNRGAFGKTTGHPAAKRSRQAKPVTQSTQGSIKSHGSQGPNTLSFPVVKNPYDPKAPRLSQGGGWSNSQKTAPSHSKAWSPAETEAEDTQYPSQDKKQSHETTASSNAVTLSQATHMTQQLRATFPVPERTTVLCFAHPPPAAETVADTMLDYDLPPVIYQKPYYSDERDVPDRPREYAGREFRLESNTVPYLPLFDPTGSSLANFGRRRDVVVNKAEIEAENQQRRTRCSLLNWEFAAAPPSYQDVEQWLENEKRGDVSLTRDAKKEAGRPKAQVSQIEGPTQKNPHGCKYSQRQKSGSVKHERQYMSVMSLEVHVNTRGTLLPDPAHDEVACIFWCMQSDEAEADSPRRGVVVLVPNADRASGIGRAPGLEVRYEEDELDLIDATVDIVREFDPDILTGYEVHNGSWGYLIERARLKYEYNLCDELSRMKAHSHGRFGRDEDRWGFTHTSTIRVTGRHMINIWRAMRSELNLLQYSMENVVFHLLHQRIPHYSHEDLSSWYRSGSHRDRAKVYDYFLSRVRLNLGILKANEILPRTCEQARLLGVDFFSVISRGSQFKVESLMFRIAKAENFILPSPSRRQVGQQNALECLPLVMEPQSGFYTSPVLVLDFQSLYPSVMIAYNYCYSTFLGRVVGWRGQNKMGFTDFKREPGLLGLVKDHVNIAPNGMMYVRPEMRKSLLAKMLGEILETRVMVKSGMAADKEDKELQQLLNNRQLALKLIANVTYGYTSASFSGRMPCSEIADSIVQTGRETLEKAIAFIHSVEEWGAEVVYGDTDSIFVHLPGRTRDEAFAIGEKMAVAVTERNPRPIKLKFEKVYHPCVLLAKKRYVGFKYESRSQAEPDFDAKGIETVRRDGTPAEQKVEETALKLLFRTQDLSQVKSYFLDQCRKIMEGRVSVQDFIFAREVKLGTYANKGPGGPPGALIATRRMLADSRTEPQYGERVPYVVVTGAPGARLADRCVAPERLLADDQLELDADYYISKNLIPPLERIFNLVGANVRAWYDDMPKVQRVRSVVGSGPTSGDAGSVPKKTLENYMRSSACLICRSRLNQHRRGRLPAQADGTKHALLPLCETCLARPHMSLLELRMRQQRAERRKLDIDAVCRSCEGTSFADEVRCDSVDCPVFYSRIRAKAKVRAVSNGTVQGVTRALEGMEW